MIAIIFFLGIILLIDNNDIGNNMEKGYLTEINHFQSIKQATWNAKKELSCC